MNSKIIIHTIIASLLFCAPSSYAMDNSYREIEDDTTHNIAKRFNNNTGLDDFTQSVLTGIIGSAVILCAGYILCDCWKWGEGPIWKRIEPCCPIKCKKFCCKTKRNTPNPDNLLGLDDYGSTAQSDIDLQRYQGN